MNLEEPPQTPRNWPRPALDDYHSFQNPSAPATPYVHHSENTSARHGDSTCTPHTNYLLQFNNYPAYFTNYNTPTYPTDPYYYTLPFPPVTPHPTVPGPRWILHHTSAIIVYLSLRSPYEIKGVLGCLNDILRYGTWWTF